MNRRIESLLSYPKSLYVCLRLLPLHQALRLPIKVRHNVKLQSLKGRVILPDNYHKAMIQFGFQYVGTHDYVDNRCVLEIDGTLEFEGQASFGSGCQLCVGSAGHLKLGHNFLNTCSGHIVATGNMTIGSGFLMAWNALVLDTDFHTIVDLIAQKERPIQKDIVIGNNVWLCARSIVTKGTVIGDGCVIGTNAVVSGDFAKANCIIAGSPATIIKQNHTWK